MNFPAVAGTPRRSAFSVAAVLLLSAILAGCTALPAQPESAPGETPTVASNESPSPSPVASDVASPPASTPKDRACDGDQCVEVAVTGDILLHPALWAQAESDGHGELNFSPLLAGITPYLAESDLALCNLETPVAAADGPFSGYPMFVVPPQIIPALKKVGYDGCTTASNHSMDAGAAGVRRTLDALDAQDMVYTGSYRSAADAKAPLLVDVDGARISVIAGTFSLNGVAEDAPWRVDDINEESLLERAKVARAAGADIVIAALHAGAEYSNTPTAEQLDLYRSLADSGAFDFIYSHHTHSVLPIEKRAGTWIVYGLGNSVAKHATATVLNKEGLSVKMQFVRTGDSWKAGNLVWAPHIMSANPIRWCALPATEPCTTKAGDAASLKRTTDTVNSMNARGSGAKMWLLSAP
ncbi:metallophosphatase [Arthrobacter sp. 7749]|uniref:CapA family protein n=1 Tax=Paeniglutamicibacter terrestris TaxID=2723403 RepID=A0ABX1G4B5_9MICC|nr:CapA family protein [Paeniglutamicibacter terrestris]ASN39241.1 metallophosphatase [Arthrobacter sp. 7749]NKG20814.1 CapA family protein [Paeniglutamicibacter terrestris]